MREKYPFDIEQGDALRALNDGDPPPLIALLRGKRLTAASGAGLIPLHPKVRALLADVLNPKGKSAWRLIFRRRKAGKPVNDWEAGARQYAIGEMVAEAREGGEKFENAVNSIAAEHKMSHSAVKAAYALYRDVSKRLRKSK